MIRTLTSFIKEGGKAVKALPDETPLDITQTTINDSLILQCVWSNRKFKLPELWEYVVRFNEKMHIIVNEIGLDIVGMDTSHVACLEIHLASKDFHKFIYTQKEPLTIPLNFKTMTRKFNRFNTQDDLIHVNVDTDDLTKREIQFECRRIHFSQPFVKLEDGEGVNELPKKLDLPFTTCCTTPLVGLIEILDFASDVADYTKFKANPSQRTLMVVGKCEEDGSKYSKTLKLRDPFTIQKRSLAMYSLEYLLDILKVSKGKGVLSRLDATLEYATALPLRITLQIAPHSYVRATIAPRVEDMEEEEIIEEILFPLLHYLLTPFFLEISRE